MHFSYSIAFHTKLQNTDTFVERLVISVLSDIKYKTNHKQHCKNFYNHIAMISGVDDNEVIFIHPSVDSRSVSRDHINMIWGWKVLPSRQTERVSIPPMLKIKLGLKKVIIEQWN